MRRDLPSGTVTFVFTDVEGSTRLLHELGAEKYALALAEHRRLLRQAFTRHGGVKVDTQGDALFYACPTAPGAIEAAREGQEALLSGPIRVRMGLHTGTPHLTEEGYVGEDVHKGARIAAAGHGGQVLLSRDMLELCDVEAFDLGEHRLKDFGEPVWIFQLGSQRFPPLKTISNSNLPRPASTFIGRKHEVEEVRDLLQDGARLLTLTGPGGTGKTRLAIEAATDLISNYRNGVFWVELAPLRDPELVMDTVAETLGARDALVEHVGEREMLLLLDNFEQVVEAAPELSSMLTVCPNVRLLVTSRELLRVQGEVEFAVPPLAQPEAVDLFCARSGLQANETIARLCRRLDDLPLAVELAAARTRVLSPAQILERISKRLDLLKGGRDADARQATLRATIDWSYDLLSDREKELFAHLAVFGGGCTLDSAEEVAGADIDTLQALLEKSLLRRTNDRFWMLETIREYAAERLDASQEAGSVRRRHAEHFVELGKQAEPHLRQESTEWLDRLEREQDNLRAALDWLEVSGEGDLALELAAATWWLWSLRGPQAEGRRLLERVLAKDPGQTRARANALMGVADMAGDAGDDATSRLRAEEALTLHRGLGDNWGTAYCLLALGLVPASQGDFAEAQPLFAESVRLFRELGDEHWAAQVTHRLAWAHYELGDIERARALHEDNLRRARSSGDQFIEARALATLAQYELEAGRAGEQVISMLEQAHLIHRDRPDLPDRHLHAILICRFARALALTGSAVEAARLLSCYEAIVEEEEMVREAWVTRMNDLTLGMVREQRDDAAITQAWEQGRTLSADAAVALALKALSPGAGHK